MCPPLLGCEDPHRHTATLSALSHYPHASICKIMDKLSFSICKKSLSLCEVKRIHCPQLDKAAGWSQWRAEHCSGGVGGGIYVTALWMWESYGGSHEKTGQLPPTLSLSHVTWSHYGDTAHLCQLQSAGSWVCALLLSDGTCAGQEILFIQINGMLLKHHY